MTVSRDTLPATPQKVSSHAARIRAGVILCGSSSAPWGVVQPPWLHPRDARSTPSHDNHRCPQTWLSVPWGTAAPVRTPALLRGPLPLFLGSRVDGSVSGHLRGSPGLSHLRCCCIPPTPTVAFPCGVLSFSAMARPGVSQLWEPAPRWALRPPSAFAVTDAAALVGSGCASACERGSVSWDAVGGPEGPGSQAGPWVQARAFPGTGGAGGIQGSRQGGGWPCCVCVRACVSACLCWAPGWLRAAGGMRLRRSDAHLGFPRTACPGWK